MRTLAEFVNQLVYHPATPETAPKHHELREAIKGLGERLWAIIPDGPEKTLALRKLQEAQMWGNLAIALMAPALEGEDAAKARVLPGEAPLPFDPAAASYPDAPLGNTLPGEELMPDTPALVVLRAEHIVNGNCTGPVAVEDGTKPCLKRAVCYYGLCTWQGEDTDPLALNIKEQQQLHNDAPTTLADQAP